MSKYKSYLGDSVYADVEDDGRLVITTENGYGPTNTVILEIEVYAALVEYVKEFSTTKENRN